MNVSRCLKNMNTSRQPVLIPRPYPERFASPEPQKLTFLLNVAHCVCPGSMYQLGSNLNVDGFSTCTPRSQSKSIPRFVFGFFETPPKCQNFQSSTFSTSFAHYEMCTKYEGQAAGHSKLQSSDSH